LVFDFVARQKLSGLHMNFFVAKQLACPTPAVFDKATPWRTEMALGDWIRPYAIELSYTSWRLKPYAQELGDDGPPFRWDPERRALLRADLDAAFMHMYGLNGQEAEHVLNSFFVVRKYDERDHGEYRTKRLVLEAYDCMAGAIAKGGKGWQGLADVPAGSGPRHERAKSTESSTSPRAAACRKYSRTAASTTLTRRGPWTMGGTAPGALSGS
jgi:hypothetical protein